MEASSELNVIIKKNLTELREAFGFSKRDIAAVLGIKENTYRVWEDMDKGLPKLSVLQELGKIYNVDISFFFKKDAVKNKGAVSGVAASGENYHSDSGAYENSITDLSLQEKQLIAKFRRVKNSDKAKLFDYLNEILEGYGEY